MTQVFAALGDPNRLEMVSRLVAQGDLRLGHVVANLPVTRQAATRHLHILRDAGLVRIERRGREQVCAIEPESLRAADQFLRRLEDQWDQRLSKLQKLLEYEDSGNV